MRLLRLDKSGELRLTSHDDGKLPPYAILSHTWGPDDSEITFQDIGNGVDKNKTGYRKIVFCGEQAMNDNLKDFWVDTCCIDKRNYTELSEAILSMFRWYQRATKCYVYLDNVTALKRDRNGMTCDWTEAFRKSRWFTRGWTLQELLAPREVEFWSRDGQLLGTKETLKGLIHEILDIPLRALLAAPLCEFPVPERLRWAARRETKKQEDKAYCLFGILHVSLDIRYGEGGDRAFDRLSAEIKREQNPTQLINTSVERREPSEKTTQARREKVLASLDFEQIDSRRSNIKEAQRKTCEWLLQHSDYSAWSSEGRGELRDRILWITGKPGAGKSTLMKYLLAHTKKIKNKDEIVLDFFFNARGDDFEKTTLGMYRALLIQLLDQAPELQSVLDSIDDSSPRKSTDVPWTLDTLQNLFHEAIQKLGTRRLKLFIDALDECNEEQVREMVDVLEDLVESDPGSDSRLSICLASRHYPSIEVRHSRRMVLEGEAGHGEDLKKYITRRLQAGKGQKIDKIRAQVQEKANGVFMWVVLVVEILNKEFRRGRIFAVEERLREIPTGLSDLFKDLLRRDRVDMDDLLLCLQWVLFAKRPLKREEFYYAMEADLHPSPEDGSQWQPQPWDPEEVTTEDMNKFVLSSSKGLAELTRSKKAPTVQFIHESVRDFLLKDGGLQELWPGFSDDPASLGHRKLQKCCSNYLVADISRYTNSALQLPKAFSEGGYKLRLRVSSQFPFLEYATQGVLYHANEAISTAHQDTLLQAFALEKWVYLNNLLEPHENRRYSDQVNLLYILAERNLSGLIKEARSDDRWTRLPNERYQFPVLTAFTHGCREALHVLLGDQVTGSVDNIIKDPGFGKKSSNKHSEDPILWAAMNRDLNLLHCLLARCSSHEILSASQLDIRGQNLLSFAVARGAPKTIQLLLDAGANVNPKGSALWTALLEAIEMGHEESVQMLLNAGASVHVRNTRGEDPLYMASCNGHQKTVRMLLDAGADVNAQGGYYGDALQAASFGAYLETVRMPLDSGADINARWGYHGSTLQAVLDGGYQEVVRMLIDAGADVNAQGGPCGNALQAASYTGHQKSVRVLLDAGADVNAQGGHFGSALQAASYGDSQTIVQMLLDAGADVNAQGGYYGNALQAASLGGNQEIVQMLMNAGSDVHIQGGVFGTALWAAMRNEHQQVVQILLDAGADSCDALQVAREKGLERDVQRFIDREIFAAP